MKAIVYHEYGSPDVLRCQEVEKPAPGDDEVLIRVRAASANPLDWHFMRGLPYFGRMSMGLRTPKAGRLGFDVAGVVEAVGRIATQFKPGDEVFGMCRGAFAECACTPESSLATKPKNVSFEQAAAVPVAAFTVLQAFRCKGQIRPGHKVLVNGASGGVGTLAVQVARFLGADVTGVCSTRNVAMAQSLGAGQVLDYTQQDFTRMGRRYDLIFDSVGNHSLSACLRVLKPGGRYVQVGAPGGGGRWMLGLIARALTAPLVSPFVGRKMAIVLAKRNQGDLTLIRELMETGKVTPVIDRRYPLSEVPDAIRYLEEGHARGKVVITMG
jgi:NADPH:quinone reductase-like Zn-dependent oxidoreductase